MTLSIFVTWVAIVALGEFAGCFACTWLCRWLSRRREVREWSGVEQRVRAMLQGAMGGGTPTPGCECPPCAAKRAAAEQAKRN